MKVSEIFGPTIQGEGDLIGQPTIFVRFGGCDYRCSWCDTLYAVLPEHRDEWRSMTPTEIMKRVTKLSHKRPILITLSGGNPAIQPPTEMDRLLNIGHLAGYSFTMETQGSVYQPWMDRLDHITVSPKPPSSGMADKLCLDTVRLILEGKESEEQVRSIKIVVFDETDLKWALSIHDELPGVPTFLQVGNWDTNTTDPDHAEDLLDSLRWLADELLKRRYFDIAVLPQLHVLMYGNRRGV